MGMAVDVAFTLRARDAVSGRRSLSDSHYTKLYYFLSTLMNDEEPMPPRALVSGYAVSNLYRPIFPCSMHTL